ncbi:hypothetical protein V2J09_014503 [Rumex salicifolius]
MAPFHHLLIILPFFLQLLTSTSTSTTVPPPSPAPSPSKCDGVIAKPPKPENSPPQPKEIDEWCATVPHPGPCKYFMGRKHHEFRPKKKPEFLQMAIQVALDRAVAAQAKAWQWRKKLDSHKERAAWVDCMGLYGSTITQLNTTLHGLTQSKCSDFDAQTWLSAALTNLQTCHVSTSDLKVSATLPHALYNVSDLISNSLAINEGILATDNSTANATASGFPAWVVREDRRLLEGRRSLAAAAATFVVAKDGSGQYKTVQAAINAAAKVGGTGRKVIYVKRGVYRENIWVNPYTSNVMLVGDGIRKTTITSGRSVKGGYTTYNSATAGIDGMQFMARDITFENAAGKYAGQAVALRSSSDLSVFYRCAFYGYQDTLFVHSQRQFYRECYIYGTIDMIFGNAASVFQKCLLYMRLPVPGQYNVVTAQGRNDPNQNTGIVIHNSRIMPAADLSPYVSTVVTFLGRPWQSYSRTVVMKTYLDSFVDAAGWREWNGDASLRTLYYAEYRNFGPGSGLTKRVKWAGYHKAMSVNAASRFTVGSFIAGRSWLPATGVPFTPGL